MLESPADLLGLFRYLRISGIASAQRNAMTRRRGEAAIHPPRGCLLSLSTHSSAAQPNVVQR